MQQVGQGLLAYSAVQSGVPSCLEPLGATGPEIMNNPNEGGNWAHFYHNKKIKKGFLHLCRCVYPTFQR